MKTVYILIECRIFADIYRRLNGWMRRIAIVVMSPIRLLLLLLSVVRGHWPNRRSACVIGECARDCTPLSAHTSAPGRGDGPCVVRCGVEENIFIHARIRCFIYRIVIEMLRDARVDASERVRRGTQVQQMGTDANTHMNNNASTCARTLAHTRKRAHARTPLYTCWLAVFVCGAVVSTCLMSHYLWERARRTAAAAAAAATVRVIEALSSLDLC